MARRIVIDTNVLISSLGWKGAPHKLMAKVVRGEYDILLCQEQYEEIIRVLDYKKFGFTAEQKESFLGMLSAVSTHTIPGKHLDLLDDKSDNMLLDAAASGKAEFIVTGDKEVRRLKSSGDAKIVSPSELLKEDLNS